MNDRTQLDALALNVVGTRPVRPDGADKVLGRANFGADLRLPGMLEGRVKRSPPAGCRAGGILRQAARTSRDSYRLCELRLHASRRI